VEESFLFTRIRRGTLLRLALGPDHRLLRPPVRGKPLLLGPRLLSTTLLLRAKELSPRRSTAGHGDTSPD